MSGILIAAAVGGAGAVVDIDAGFIFDDVRVDPANAASGVIFESDGDILELASAGNTDQGNWITPKAAAPGGYEIFVHQDSGGALAGTSDALDTWLALTSSRTWSVEQTSLGAITASLTVSIRLAGVTLSTGVVTLEAEVV